MGSVAANFSPYSVTAITLSTESSSLSLLNYSVPILSRLHNIRAGVLWNSQGL